jgi:hypothetical protein
MDQTDRIVAELEKLNAKLDEIRASVVAATQPARDSSRRVQQALDGLPKALADAVARGARDGLHRGRAGR